MRAFTIPRNNGLVRYEPGISPTPEISPSGFPPRDVGLIFVRHSYGQAVQFHVAGPSEMEDVFVRIREITATVNRFDMSHIDIFGESVVIVHSSVDRWQLL